MCGICGFLHQKKLEHKDLQNMNNVLVHRGPDREGYYLYDFKEMNYQIGLAHRRLSIIDLSDLGKQPMVLEGENVIITYNGEIYNYKIIREELIKKGYKFNSDCDTEVILNSYLCWGIDCVNKFNGMFAFAIFDKKNNELFLVRDRIGVKPLYYYYNGIDIVFASELKAIMKYPFFNKVINKKALNMFLFHGYIAAPFSIFDNTYKVMPGSYLKFKMGKLEEVKYWDLSSKYINQNNESFDDSENDYKVKLHELLIDSVKLRMISDVPLGAFLSGGVDSSLIVSLMQINSSKKIKTFTIGFNESNFNEAEYAKKVANHLGTEHYELYLSIKKAEEIIFDISTYYDEPFADSSQLPTILLSRFTKEHVSVALSGDGGDELFCGYDRYENLLKLQKFKSLSKILNVIDIKEKLAKVDRKLLKLYYLNNDDSIVNSEYEYSKYYLGDLINENYIVEDVYKKILNITDDIQDKSMLLDITTSLPDDMLTKVDRASMSASLEVRVPLLDYRVIEFALKSPKAIKYKDGNKKVILKNILEDYIPKELIERPKKGFSVPIISWLYKDLNYIVEKYLDKDYIAQQSIFNFEKISFIKRKFYEKKDPYYQKVLWNIIVFQLWYEKYMCKKVF